MKLISSFILCSSILLLTAFSSVEKEKVHGKWFAPAMENATVEIYTAEDGYVYGKILDCDEPTWIGEIVLKKLVYDEAKNHWQGKVYSIKRKMTADVKITVPDEQRLKLACTKWLITKNYYWSKQ